MRIFLSLLVILLFALRVEAEPRKLSESDAAVMVSAVESVCPLMVQEAQLVASIKEEKANPTGVVNLRILYELGQSLQSTRSELRHEKKVGARGIVIFRRWAGKNLDLGFCVVHERDREAQEEERDVEAAAEDRRYRN